MDIILKPFAWLLLFFNNITGNYGLALILFTLAVKLILFPFALKGKRGMIKTTMIQGQVQRIQKQYANNREKMNEELQKLYTEEKVNPMGGCLWSMLPIIILIPLYAIIRQPLQYLMGVPAYEIANVATKVGYTIGNGAYEELMIAARITNENLAAAQTVCPSIFPINFNFLGIDLTQVPRWDFWANGLDWGTIGLFLLPIISVALSYLMSFVTNRTNAVNNPEAAKMTGGNRMLMLLMPLTYLFFGFMMPGGMAVYILASSVFTIIQEIVAGKMLKKDYEAAAEERRKRELMAKEEEKRKKQALAEERARRLAEKKQSGGKKKDKKPAAEPGVDRSASRVGLRAYARGRAYDPNRYGGVTEYKDPSAPVDEAAIEAALEKKAAAREEAEIQAAVDARVEAELERDYAEGKLTGQTEDETPDTPEVEPEVPEDAQEPGEGDETLTQAPQYDAPDYSKKDKED